MVIILGNNNQEWRGLKNKGLRKPAGAISWPCSFFNPTCICLEPKAEQRLYVTPSCFQSKSGQMVLLCGCCTVKQGNTKDEYLISRVAEQVACSDPTLLYTRENKSLSFMNKICRTSQPERKFQWAELLHVLVHAHERLQWSNQTADCPSAVERPASILDAAFPVLKHAHEADFTQLHHHVVSQSFGT